MVPSLLLHSLPSRLRKQPRWMLNLSVFSCADACTCPPPPLHAHLPMCCRQLDMFGHHRATCAVAGVLGKRGFPLECAAAQICHEAGAKVTTIVHVRDILVAVFNNLDGRRLEVVADGLTLWHGAQLAIDTTLVSPLHRDGSARARAADHNGGVLVEARRRKE